MTKFKICKSCDKDETKVEFYPKRRVCKVCTSLKITNYIMEKKAKANPRDYKSCNDCDRTFKRYKPCTRRIEVDVCKMCGSYNIEEYV